MPAAAAAAEAAAAASSEVVDAFVSKAKVEMKDHPHDVETPARGREGGGDQSGSKATRKRQKKVSLEAVEIPTGPLKGSTVRVHDFVIGCTAATGWKGGEVRDLRTLAQIRGMKANGRQFQLCWYYSKETLLFELAGKRQHTKEMHFGAEDLAIREGTLEWVPASALVKIASLPNDQPRFRLVETNEIGKPDLQLL